MNGNRISRRRLLRGAVGGVGLAAAAAMRRSRTAAATALPGVTTGEGAQRLSLDQLRGWEAWRFGMFVCFGMSTFLGDEFPSGNDPAATYNPDRLDVDSWIQIARDAGMQYAVLTAKHVAGHCLWPSDETDYTVAQSGNATDVVEAFVRACQKRGIRPGLYYCSWDNRHRFGSRTPSDFRGTGDAFTTSYYQTFQTNQITELLRRYGPIAEVWIDMPALLGRGYRTYLYDQIAALQPGAVIVMNSGVNADGSFPTPNAWPSDAMTYERKMPPAHGHPAWQRIEGQSYYIPGEVCDTLGKNWFFLEDDSPRPDDALAELAWDCRERRANLLLSVGPDRRGLIPSSSQKALERLRRNLDRGAFEPPHPAAPGEPAL